MLAFNPATPALFLILLVNDIMLQFDLIILHGYLIEHW